MANPKEDYRSPYEYTGYPGCPDNPDYPEYPSHPDCPYYPEYPDYKIYPWIDLAEAFVLWQRFGRLYPPEEALMKGTLFPGLWRPYQNRRR
ncbi:MAG: hypothetical protein PWQ96_476 [Clostridia bacterium]|jgi:hypothetical protein|nr:hypothetical protein [Clostridiales bacterium]MDK2984834.1 hypothetical protein [Clostridia bacterium]